MKTEKVFPLILCLESLLVLIGVAMKHDVWVSVMCYWAVVLIKNISDFIREGKRHD